MSFLQRWIRPFLTRQEVAPPKSHEDNSKSVDVKVNVEEESDSESVIFVRKNQVSKQEANLRDDPNLEDNIHFQDDADLNRDSIPEDDANPQADVTQDDSAPNGLRSFPKGYVSPYPANVSPIDDKRTPRKSEAERRYFDLLLYESESSSEDETVKKDQDTTAGVFCAISRKCGTITSFNSTAAYTYSPFNVRLHRYDEYISYFRNKSGLCKPNYGKVRCTLHKSTTIRSSASS
ncbi:hypothetical protein ZTR_02301 [Talaromyces verruculosus]|nr:hypothetical protein ZTR_02301 [Talaromyces verruculosus]